MVTSLKAGLFGVAAATFIGALFLFAPAVEASHSWNGYHWARTANSFTVKLGDNVNTAAWGASLALASSDWTLSGVLDTTIVAGGTNAAKGRNTPKNCIPTNGRVEVCNASYGSTGWLGVAQVWLNGGHIAQGTVKVNDTYFNTSTYNKPAWRQFVMCQEIGHTLGLDHQDENFNNANLGTCMDYTNDPARDDGAGNNQHPNQHDYDELAFVYAHLDTFTTLSSSLTAKPGASALAQSGDFENASEWGRVIRTSSDGRPSLYVRDLGNGNKVFTFVIWAQ